MELMELPGTKALENVQANTIHMINTIMGSSKEKDIWAGREAWEYRNPHKSEHKGTVFDNFLPNYSLLSSLRQINIPTPVYYGYRTFKKV